LNKINPKQTQTKKNKPKHQTKQNKTKPNQTKPNQTKQHPQNKNTKLNQHMLSMDYFQRTPPKTTGRELFTFELGKKFKQKGDEICNGIMKCNDFLATLTELTAISIVDAYWNCINNNKQTNKQT